MGDSNSQTFASEYFFSLTAYQNQSLLFCEFVSVNLKPCMPEYQFLFQKVFHAYFLFCFLFNSYFVLITLKFDIKCYKYNQIFKITRSTKYLN